MGADHGDRRQMAGGHSEGLKQFVDRAVVSALSREADAIWRKNTAETGTRAPGFSRYRDAQHAPRLLCHRSSERGLDEWLLLGRLTGSHRAG